MAIRATLEFSYRDRSLAETVQRAISLDAGDIDGGRSKAAVSREDETVVVEIDAADANALRAAKRTWCAHVATAEATAITAR